MHESLQTVAALKPVRRGGGGCRSRMLRRSVRESATAAIDALRTITLTSRRELGRRRPLKKTTTVLWTRRGRRGLRQHFCSIFRWLLHIAYRTYWVRDLQQPRSFHSGPVRRGASDRTTRPGMSSRDEEIKGESAESVVDGGIGPKTLPDAGEENTPHNDRDDRLRRRPRGDCEELVGFFP